ncbi:toxin-antitoxin system YwqK family antitoxin [Janthinobacterium sp.]|uniref:toxin-antitoxin system YwqK family antitoxin n=1 Tax=Janthinobacterium sp. TaxID=1871054 RepID=UPI00261D0946|nr:toxin-antitoxin system YwqK family antitoxin [Janthinobacterium sp.]
MNPCKTALLAALLWPCLAHADIVQRQVITGMGLAPDSQGADVLTVASDTACGGRQVRMDARSVDLDDAAYAALKTTLAAQVRDGSPMLLTLASCPVGETAEMAVPIVRKLAACRGESVGAVTGTCTDGRARLYLQARFFPVAQADAENVLLLPLAKGHAEGTWRVEVLDVSEQYVRMAGLVDASDYAQGKLVRGYTVYYPGGKVEKKVAQDAQGRQDGVSSTYYPDGTLETQGGWRAGLPEGLHREFHSTGKLRVALEYRNGKSIDGPVQSFDESGSLNTSYELRGGKMEGELLIYYPDGKIASRRQVSKGKFNGVSIDYFSDGAVRSSMPMVDDLPVGEALEFYPSGSVQTQQQYDSKGRLRNTRRYSAQGLLVLERRWDGEQREQGISRSWYDNGQLEHAIAYVDDKRHGWSRSWREDGSLASECRYVAGEAQENAQGDCSGASPSATVPQVLQTEQAWRSLH